MAYRGTAGGRDLWEGRVLKGVGAGGRGLRGGGVAYGGYWGRGLRPLVGGAKEGACPS